MSITVVSAIYLALSPHHSSRLTFAGMNHRVMHSSVASHGLDTRSMLFDDRKLMLASLSASCACACDPVGYAALST